MSAISPRLGELLIKTTGASDVVNDIYWVIMTSLIW